MLFVYPEEVAGTLVLKFLSRLIILLSFISHPQSHNFTNIFNHLEKHKKRFIFAIIV